MILSKLGSAAVWSLAFSTSIRISRPTRFRPTGTVNPRRSSGALVGGQSSCFDAIGSDFHAAKQCHERRFDFVRCVGSEILRDLAAAFNQLSPPWTTVRFIVDGIEDRSGVGEKFAKPVDHQ